jgi:methionyl-tRNA formyltransferase
VYDCRLQRTATSASPGQVIAIGTEEIQIAVPGGAIIAKKMRGEGGKIAAAEFAQQTGLSVGAQLF